MSKNKLNVKWMKNKRIESNRTERNRIVWNRGKRKTHRTERSVVTATSINGRQPFFESKYLEELIQIWNTIDVNRTDACSMLGLCESVRDKHACDCQTSNCRIWKWKWISCSSESQQNLGGEKHMNSNFPNRSITIRMYLYIHCTPFIVRQLNSPPPLNYVLYSNWFKTYSHAKK